VGEHASDFLAAKRDCDAATLRAGVAAKMAEVAAMDGVDATKKVVPPQAADDSMK
jgi:hypothetical protein